MFTNVCDSLNEIVFDEMVLYQFNSGWLAGETDAEDRQSRKRGRRNQPRVTPLWEATGGIHPSAKQLIVIDKAHGDWEALSELCTGSDKELLISRGLPRFTAGIIYRLGGRQVGVLTISFSSPQLLWHNEVQYAPASFFRTMKDFFAHCNYEEDPEVLRYRELQKRSGKGKPSDHHKNDFI